MGRQEVGRRLAAAAVHAPLAVVALVFVVAPVGLTLGGAATGVSRPGGFGRGQDALWQLAGTSLLLALAPAIAATSLALWASAEGIFNARFARRYRTWLSAMLFTNPIFLVLGFSAVFASLPATPAILAATTFVVWPLAGLVVDAGAREFPQSQLLAARALGAQPWQVLTYNLLPALLGTGGLAVFLAAAYSLGFYLLPTYVGLGRVVTLGSAINTAVNRVGDWPAAQQLAGLMVVLQLALLAVWLLTRRAVSAGLSR